eukprot:g2650.t1
MKQEERHHHSHVKDALLAAENDVSLAYARFKIMRRPDKMELRVDSSRPVLVVDLTDGKRSKLNAAIVKELETAGHTTVRVSVGGSNSTRGSNSRGNVVGLDTKSESKSSSPEHRLLDSEESSIRNMFDSIEGDIGGFLAIVGDIKSSTERREEAHERLRWLMLAAKHLGKTLNRPIESGRTFFAVAVVEPSSLENPSDDDENVVDDMLLAQYGASYGLCKTLDLEWPNVFCRGIGISSALDPTRAAVLLTDELCCPNLFVREVTYDKSGVRRSPIAISLEREVEAVEMESTTTKTTKTTSRNRRLVTPSDSDVWLVAGGGRGITPLCVAALAGRVGGGHFFLMGRSAVLASDPAWAKSSATEKDLKKHAMAELKRRWKTEDGPKPTPSLLRKIVRSVQGSREIRASIEAIEAKGGVASYVRCDVTSPEQVADAFSAVRKSGLRLTGIVHASGVLRDKRIENKTSGDFDAVFGVKVGGLGNLLHATTPEERRSLRHLVVFSSLAGFHGNVGQADYAMANEALARIARSFAMTYPSCRARAFCYGPWDGGMVTPGLKKHFKSLGVQIIPRKSGAELTAALICGGDNRLLQCLVGNWGVPPSKVRSSAVVTKWISGKDALFLNSHRIHGKKVLPMAVAMSHALSVVERLHPGWTTRTVTNGRLFRGVRFETEEDELVLKLDMERLASASSNAAVVKCKMFVGRDPAYACDVSLLRDRPGPTPDVFVALTADEATRRWDLYEDGKTLFHGPHFHMIDEVLHVNDAGLAARCSLPREVDCESLAGFEKRGVHADVLLQLMLVWVRETRGFASLPSSIGSLEFIRPLPRRFYASLRIVGDSSSEGRGKKKSRVEADCVLTDAVGRVYVRAKQVAVTVSETLSFTQEAEETPRKEQTKTPELGDDRIAVVGMSVTYAGARNLDAFWKCLVDGKVHTKPISSPWRRKRGGGEETERDMLLRLAKEALADCKVDGKPSSVNLDRCGIVNGSLNFPLNDGTQEALIDMYADKKPRDPPSSSGDPASYVARKLGLGCGEHYSVDAACATALYTLKFARDALLRGDVDAMLCSAVTKPEPFFVLSGFSAFRALPPKGQRSAPFQRDSKGLTPGEGGAVFVLKRLVDAVRDNDRVYGVLRSVHLENAGRGLPLKPDEDAELSCLRGAYNKNLDILPRSVQYVECHATGTAQGDACELGALRTLFGGDDKMPMIGSTKGAFGHTLVAAGFAGMAKLLLAMTRGVIPPTPFVEGAGPFVSDKVVTKAVPWTGAKRCGAVSAFGFGGTNAHAVFEAWGGEEGSRSSYPAISRPIPQQKVRLPIDIVGIGLQFGGDVRDLRAFERALFGLEKMSEKATSKKSQRPAECDLPPKRWRVAGESVESAKLFGLPDPKTVRGCFMRDVDVDYKRLRLPLLKEDELLPQQLVALSVMESAIDDAGGDLGPRTAVLVGLETEMELYRHRVRCALKERGATKRELDRMSDAGTSTSYTSNIGNIVATRIAALHGFVGPALTITSGERSVDQALKLARAMIASGEVDSAVVAGVDLCGSAEALWRRRRQSSVREVGEGSAAVVLHRRETKRPKRVYATIIAANDDGDDDDKEEEGREKTERGGSSPPVRVFDAKKIVGDVGCATGAAALVKTALCLYHRRHPSSFASWIVPAAVRTRRAYSRGVLLEEASHGRRCLHLSPSSSKQLFVFEATSVDGILRKVGKTSTFEEAVRRTARNESQARELWSHRSSNLLALCLVASPETFDAERRRALQGLKSRASATDEPWRSPAGSYFTPDPLRSSNVAFVYGDGSAPYEGLGEELHRMYPTLHDIMESKTKTTPRPMTPSTSQIDVFRNGVYWSVCFTEIAKGLLGLNPSPSSSFGLSLGEISMLFAFSNSNCAMSETIMKRLQESPVWSHKLAGEFDTLRDSWAIDKKVPVADFWSTFAFRGVSRDVLENAIAEKKERVRVLIVNDDDTLVVGGVPQDCRAVAARLKATLLPLPRAGRMLAHCAEAATCKTAIEDIHASMEIPTGVRLSQRSIAGVYTEIADFPKSVRRHDADVFVEVGPGDARTQAIRSILKSDNRRGLAVSMDAEKKTSAWAHLLATAAQLRSHYVEGVFVDTLCDPEILFDRREDDEISEEARLRRRRFLKRVEINGRFGASMSSSQNQKLGQELAYHRARAKTYKGPLIWDFDDLLEYAEGKIAPVFNKQLSGDGQPSWDLVDTYRRRVRLPAREYLLVSRVTHMNATTGVFEAGATMTTEYDIPPNSELSEGGDVPWAVLVESGQCDLMLISYLGIDFQCKGDRVYRLLNTTLKFYGVASEGQTLQYKIRIDGFARRGKEISMFFFSYDCFCDGKLLIEMRGGCAGFFTDAELDAGKGIIRTNAEIKKRNRTAKKCVDPYLVAPSSKRKLNESDMVHLCTKGHTEGWGKILGPTAADVKYKLCARKMRMIDRIVEIDPRGGVKGLGRIVGEKDLAPSQWQFPCHFVGDQVMAGSLVSDGCSQLLKVYMIWLGLHKTTTSLVFRPVKGAANKVRCRGQISPHHGKLVYVMEIVELGFDPKTMQPYAIADVDIVDVLEDQTFCLDEFETKYGRGDQKRKIVVDFKGIALTIESTPSEAHPMLSGKRLSSRSLSSHPSIPKELMRYGPVPEAVKDKYTALSWHPLAGVDGNPVPGFAPTRFPPRPIAFLPFPGNPLDTNHTPGVLPLSWFNMCEFMCNRVSKCLGDEFAIFDDSNTSRSPAWDLALVTRVLSVADLEQGSFFGVDTNPSKGSMIAQFDCPRDAWFFRGSSNDDLMPYSILMEIGLQTAGILTSWVKAPLTMKRKNILFRNLDATATLTKPIGGTNGLDLRNKTITNRSVCTGYSMFGNMAVHRFICELLADEEVFYRVETSFGWFIPEVFEKQVGLDQGKKLGLWHEREKIALDATFELSAKGPVTNSGLRRRSAQTQFLDRASIARGSGKFGKGYVHGTKKVNKQDWFFSCHFWCDPVMPGSLGIESMLQCVEYFCGFTNLARSFANPRFVHEPGTTKWKYRGQLTPRNDRMDSEVHIKSIAKSDGKIVVVADGYLYVDGLRVYEAIDLRVSVIDASSSSSSGTRSKASTCVVGGDDRGDLRSALLDLSNPVEIAPHTHVPACTPADLGDPNFMKSYGVRYPLYTGAMAKAIASAELVIAAGKAGILASFGAGGLPIDKTVDALDAIQTALPDGPYAVNLIHSPDNDSLERDNVELFLKRGVRVVEASAFMKLTPHVVRYRVAGLEDDGKGGVRCRNKIIFKLSRTELARMALSAPPKAIVTKLVAKGLVTAEQAALASRVCMCDDVAVEADSGGHTDRRPLHVLFPLIVAERDRIAASFPPASKVRVGAGGGIGTPEAAQAAFSLGADFVVTGSVNQISREAGTSDHVRKLLSEATYCDVAMAPAADMFAQGVKLQVLKRGTLFPGRAEWLWKLFCENDSLDGLSEKAIGKLEKLYFRKTIEEQWEDTKKYYLNRLHDAKTVAQAERDSKLKMSLVMRAYLSRSSRWANDGDSRRKFDYQIWCGPCIGGYNSFAQGSHLDPTVAGGKYPSVVDINREIMLGAAFRRRCSVASAFTKRINAKSAFYKPGESRASLPILLAGVIDGHGGSKAMLFLKNNFVDAFETIAKDLFAISSSENTSFVPQSPETTCHLLDTALNLAFEEADCAFERESLALVLQGQWAAAHVGACLLVAAITSTHILVANAGDCRAVLAVRDDDGTMSSSSLRAVQISNDHNAREQTERAKLILEHPNEPNVVVEYPGTSYIKGALQTTRSIGDFNLKSKTFNDALPSIYRFREPFTPPYVSSKPEVAVVPRSDTQEFLILATDGLFDELSNEQVVSIVDRCSRRDDPSQRLTIEALRHAARDIGITAFELSRVPRGARRRNMHDDMTVMVIRLQ